MNLENFDALQQRFEFVKEHFHQLCRICLETKSLTPIFLNNSNETGEEEEDAASEWIYNDERNIGTLLEKQYIPFNPEDEYGLPNNICEKCVDNLVRWNRFREQFASSTKLLAKVRDQLMVETCVKQDPYAVSDHDDQPVMEEEGEDEEVEFGAGEDVDGPEELEEEEEQEEILLESDEFYEIEYVQKLPENVTVANATVIEMIDDVGAIEKDVKFIPANVGIDIEGSHLSEQATPELEPQDLKDVYFEIEDQQPRKKKRKRPRNEAPEDQKPSPSQPSTQDQQRSEQCPICGIIVKAKMKHHLMRHADPSGRPFKCSECNKSYSFKRTLADHVRHVHNHVRFSCDICDKEFVSRDVLRIHKKLHADEEHHCDICGQVFQQRMYLKKHMAVHETKKFACDDCGKDFRFKELLKQHQRIHTGEKPFPCPDCTKSFRTSSHLKQHSRTHTQEKVFKCGVCPVAYANKKSLDKHASRAHPQETGDR